MKKNLFYTLPIAAISLFNSVVAQEPNFVFAEDPSLNQGYMQQVKTTCAADYVPYRILCEKDSMGYSVRTDDGAVWSVKDDTSRYNVKEWRVNDTLVIHPCWSPYWSGGIFFLENERTKTTATVDLTLSPYTATDTSVALSFINPRLSEVYVTDAFNQTFKFFTDPSDYYILSSWNTGEFVLFGSNENCSAGLFSSYPYIIINIHTREFVHAKMANY